jgi:hypothetical protein
MKIGVGGRWCAGDVIDDLEWLPSSHWKSFIRAVMPGPQECKITVAEE